MLGRVTFKIDNEKRIGTIQDKVRLRDGSSVNSDVYVVEDYADHTIHLVEPKELLESGWNEEVLNKLTVL